MSLEDSIENLKKEIIQLKQREKDLQLRNKQLRKMIDLVPGYIVSRSLDGQFLLVNRTQAENMPNCTNADEVEGKYDRDFVKDEKLVNSWRMEDARLIEEGGVLERDIKIPQKDGSRRWYKTIRIPYNHPGYDRPAVIGIGVDIHLQKSLEISLKRSEERFRDAANVSGEFLLELNKDLKIIFISPQIDECIDYSEQELLGEYFYKYFYKDDLDAFKEKVSMIKKSEDNNIRSFEIRLVKKNGSIVWVSLSLMKKFDESGVFLCFRGSMRDITERRIWQKELEKSMEVANEANKTKSQFLANMSHEIRTPMNGILGFLQLLEITDLNEEQEEYVNYIKNSAKSMMDIINDILDITRIESGKLNLEMQQFNLLDNINLCFLNFERMAIENAIKYTVNIDENLPENVKGDNNKFAQVLNNLISNAIKFTYQGNVTLSVDVIKETENAYEVKFIVADQGVGINEKKLEKIFEPFYQIDCSSTKKHQGMGLGLYITKSIIEFMKGSIIVYSKPNEGTRVEVLIPFEK